MACDCLKIMDDHLAQYNSRVCVAIVFGNGAMDGRAHVPTEKINPKNRERKGVIATFCPFCGERYVPPESRAEGSAQ